MLGRRSWNYERHARGNSEGVEPDLNIAVFERSWRTARKKAERMEHAGILARWRTLL